jgi:hypothetical protein
MHHIVDPGTYFSLKVKNDLGACKDEHSIGTV